MTLRVQELARTFAAAGVEIKVTLHTHSAAAAPLSLPPTKCLRAACPFAAHSQALSQMRGVAVYARHSSLLTSVTGHCCVACLQNAGSHGPACQQVLWQRPSLQSVSAAAAASASSSRAAPLQAGGNEVELVLECAAALRAGVAGGANTQQVNVALQ
jgi:hypothetical protein